MKISIKNSIIAGVSIIIMLSGGNALGQLDNRFGAKGVEGTAYLGQQGLSWFRDWEDSYLKENFPAPGKNKIWTVGKIDYRSDTLGMDYKWIILDLLEDTDVDFLQSLLNLCIAIVDSNIIPPIGDYWTTNKPLLEKQLTDMLNNFTYSEKMLGIKYRARCKNTKVTFQDTLPKFILTVAGDSIIVTTSATAIWKTHIYIEAWVLNPNPFNWGYFWKDIGDADCKFETTIQITGNIGLEGQGRDRHLQVNAIIPDSRTESNIDWRVFGIDFNWESLSNSIEDRVDKQIESTMKDELNKEPITTPYYFVDFFKSLFSNDIVPTQQEILDRIWNGEKSYIKSVIKGGGYQGAYWSIGYEPNWFPRLEPAQYAAFYTKYYRAIKSFDPQAKVMSPSLLLTEAIDNTGEIGWHYIPEIFQALLGPIKEEFEQLINSYFNRSDSKTWYQEFISLLPSDVKVDVNDFHIYPMKADFQTIAWDSLTDLMDDMAVFMRNVSQADDVWVSEFGNIDGKRSETEVAEMCRKFCQYFKTNSVGIDRWFWFLSRGQSPFYDIPFAPKPPMTTLLKNDFTLTQVGKAYLFEADNTPPIMESAPTDEGKYTNPGKISFYWKEAKELDTGIMDYQLQVKAEPGNKIIFNESVGNKLSGSITCYSGFSLFARVQAKNGAGLIGGWSAWSNGIIINSPDSSDSKIADGSGREKMPDRKSSSGDASDNSEEIDATTGNSERDDGLSGTESAIIELPNSFRLSQNYPNPFNSATAINYQLSEDAYVVIKIFNAQGLEIRTLVDEYKTTGYYTAPWDGKNNNNDRVVSGIYLYRMHAGNHIDTKKMTILK
ncbi:MAG TPA: FlgD immunoglobulin-like domain containing protein [bacterium]